MVSFKNLPLDIITEIVLFTGDFIVAETLVNYTSIPLYLNPNHSNTLVYGNIQSGKTNAIVNIIKKYMVYQYLIVLIIPNQLLALNQYNKTFKNKNITTQIINYKTKIINKNTNVLLLINNKFRFHHFTRIIHQQKYILLLDESDQIYKNVKKYLLNTPLYNNILYSYHITATPFIPKRNIKEINLTNLIKYNNIIKVTKPDNYYGIGNNKINIKINNLSIQELFETFLMDKHNSTIPKIMLINRYSKIQTMKETAETLFLLKPNVPIILLNSKKYIYLSNRKTKITETSLNKIIDLFHTYSHIVIISFRLSTRCISYTSSDYKIHITTQVAKVRQNYTSFMQSLRICGIYNDSPNLSLYIHTDEENLFLKHKSRYENLDINKLLN